MKGLLKIYVIFSLVTCLLTSSAFTIQPPDENRIIVIRSLYAASALDDSHEEHPEDPITRQKWDAEAAKIENESGLNARKLCEETDFLYEQEEDLSPSSPTDFSQQ